MVTNSLSKSLQKHDVKVARVGMALAVGEIAGHSLVKFATLGNKAVILFLEKAGAAKQAKRDGDHRTTSCLSWSCHCRSQQQKAATDYMRLFSDQGVLS